jgi:hypothetical protein
MASENIKYGGKPLYSGSARNPPFTTERLARLITAAVSTVALRITTAATVLTTAL